MIDVRQTGLAAQVFAERLLGGYGVSVLAGRRLGRVRRGIFGLGWWWDGESWLSPVDELQIAPRN